MTGYYKMHRGWMDDPMFQKITSNNPMSHREVWCWLVENVCWKPAPFDAGGEIVTIERGELCMSQKALGDEWGWGKSKVERYLEKLEMMGAISVAPVLNRCSKIGANTRAKGVKARSVISICNYSKYQGDEGEGEAKTGSTTDSSPVQRRGIKEEGKKERRKDIRTTGSLFEGETDQQPDQPTDPNLDEVFERFWKAYPSRGAKGNPKKPAKEKFMSKVKNGADPETIIAGAVAYAEQTEQEGTPDNFVAMAKSWLNAERWGDYDTEESTLDAEEARKSQELQAALQAARYEGPEALKAFLASLPRSQEGEESHERV